MATASLTDTRKTNGSARMSNASRHIRDITGFRPCLNHFYGYGVGFRFTPQCFSADLNRTLSINSFGTKLRSANQPIKRLNIKPVLPKEIYGPIYPASISRPDTPS